IRNAAPEKEGQTGSEFQVRDAIWTIRGSIGWISLDTHQEFRTGQNRPQRHLDARIEIAFLPRIFVERERHPDILTGYGPPICPARESGDDSSGAPFFFGRSRRPADKHTFAAWCVACTRRVERSGDGDGVDGRLNSRMAVVVEVSHIRLPLGLNQ